jgi:hypothetical protein
MENTQTHKPLYQYAGIIKRNWDGLGATAKPYVQAMFELDQITDNYGADSAQSIVRYFLANASAWRGDVARQTKAELKRLVGGK